MNIIFSRSGRPLFGRGSRFAHKQPFLKKKKPRSYTHTPTRSLHIPLRYRTRAYTFFLYQFETFRMRLPIVMALNNVRHSIKYRQVLRGAAYGLCARAIFRTMIACINIRNVIAMLRRFADFPASFSPLFSVVYSCTIL